MISNSVPKAQTGFSLLEVLTASALVSLLSVLLIEGGVFIQREVKFAEQSLQVLNVVENRLERHRLEVLTGESIAFENDLASSTLQIAELQISSQKKYAVSSLGISGTHITVSASWTDPWRRQQSLSLSTWVAFK
ncbi:prepilin-type N-terminal cleavage/methylation domain-containing protein [Vibrio neonatus]|uniref:prepilin-type N-terminal cleavage/methylation domain-containing protein n=1 Tax=Vibrio neonatus TaxID=278860 RepID=UPI0021C31984|nr:prepilin-type N-terminal cleavage/methylation domain-containing protein [Vibrio neonatus]